MAANKKPRRKYNPNKLCGIKNKPRLDSVYLLFQPIYEAIERIESGEIEAINGRVVFRDFEGTWCDLAYAMNGWVDCWERIGRNEGIEFDGAALRRIAKKIDYDVPLTPEDVAVFRSQIGITKRMFMALPVDATKRNAQTECIQIEVDRLKLGSAA